MISKKEAENFYEMQEEYDFETMKGGSRGKYLDRYCKGHTVEIRKENGNLEIQHFLPKQEVIILEPDVQAYFSDSQAVNQALRHLIALIPERNIASKTKVQ